MKKLLFILIIALLCIPVMAANRFGDTYHAVQVKDETGRNVTDITNLFIYLAGTTTNATIYSDKARQNTITIPMTEASANTTLVDGLFTWWGPETWDFSMSNDDAVGPMTNAGHADRDSAGGILVFPSYLSSINTAAYLDAETLTMGTGADWVFQGGNVANQLSFTPIADDSTVNFGVSGTGLNTNFNVFTGTSLGFKLSSSGATHSLTYDGGIANLNPSSNFAVNICTGTSTGATTIGNSAGGAVSIDTDTSFTFNADDASSIKTSAGTLLIEVTGGDLTIDSPDKSILIDSGEAVSDAIVIAATAANGAIELTTAAGTGDITLDSGDDIFLEADNGTGDVISIINTQGTSAAAIVMTTTAAGSFDINSGDNVTIDTADDFDVTTADGGITLTAAGGTNGDVTIVSANDTVITSSGKVTITNTEAMTVSGATTLTGAATATAGIQSAAVTVTATTDGLTTGLIPSGTAFVTVTSDTATKVVVLPASVIGNVIWITVPATGCELQTLATTNETINTVDCDGTNELALVAGSIYRLVCTKSITWVATGASDVGANEDSLTPDTDS